MTELTWQKSSFSEGAGANCVYVAAHPTGRIHLQESDAPATTLATSPTAFAALIRTLTPSNRTVRVK
ncbi:DUF397 domain-containing protein [Streptomyces sp. NPDC020607]|uniref:DUF397 domain-containing protein n=1 Tax=Streptomyces sp. NPDC020607 TaxID=3365082 RepID=UPI00378DDECE